MTARVLASDFRREVARVTPRSPAAFSLCKTQAHLGALPSRQPPSPAFPSFPCRSRAPVDQMASGGRPPRTYVPGGNDADAGLFLSRFCLGLAVVFLCPINKPVANMQRLGSKSAFSLSSFTFIKRLFSSSSLSALRVMSSAYL